MSDPTEYGNTRIVPVADEYGYAEVTADWYKAHHAVCMSRSKFASDKLWHEHMVAMDNIAAYITRLERVVDAAAALKHHWAPEGLLSEVVGNFYTATHDEAHEFNAALKSRKEATDE